MASNSESNLLFAVFALQHDLISAEQLVSASHQWVRDKSKSLADLLCSQGAVDEDECGLITKLVEKHLAKRSSGEAESITHLVRTGGQSDQTIASNFHLRKDPRIDQSLGLLAGVSEANLDTPEADTEPSKALELPTNPDILKTSPRTQVTETVEHQGTSSGQAPRFTKLRDHARGGLGVVSVARDEQFNREVALKEIRAEYADAEDSQRRFYQEALINGGLEHPSIVPVYAMGSGADGRPYYAMRFIRGESLKRSLRRLHKTGNGIQWVGNERAKLNRLLSQFIDACNAVAYAHSRGVIHRDLKPSNIMVGKFGETLVVDWGLAKSIGRDGSTRGDSDEMTLVPSGESGSTSMNTRIGQAIGTPQYMSPEQASGNLSKVGVASDIFNLGATLYEILTGRAPYLGEEFESIENGDFTPPRLVNPSIDPGLEAICLKAMSLRPRDRYVTAQDLTQDVEAWQADFPITARRDTRMDQSRRWMRKHQSLVAGALAAMIVFAVSLGVLAAVVSSANGQLKKSNEAILLAQADAEQNAQTAREQSELALSALNSIVFNVQSRLKGVPAASTARRDLLRTALDGLTKVSERIQLRGSIARNQSQALLELGEVFMTIGDDPELGTALGDGTKLIQQATDIREDELARNPDSSIAKRELCLALSQLGEAAEKSAKSSEAEQHYGRMMQLSRELVSQDPSDENLSVMALTHTKIGDLQLRIGSSRNALEEYQKAIDILDRLLVNVSVEGRNETLRKLADAHNRNGIALSRIGDVAKATEAHERSLVLIEQVMETSVEQYNDKRTRASYLMNLGKICLEQRRIEEALNYYTDAYEVRSAIAEIDPSNARVQSDLANIHSRLGELHLRDRNFDKSIMHYTAAKDIAGELAAADPSSSDAKLQLSQAFTNIAGVYFSSGDLEESLASHIRSKEIAEEMVEADPRDATRVRDLAITMLNIGMAYQQLGELESSIAAYSKSVDVCDQLYIVDPDDANIHDHALDAYWHLSDLYQVIEESDKVLETFRRAIAFSQKVLAGNPQNLQGLADQMEMKGYMALYQGELHKAAEAAKKFADANPDIFDNLYNAACIYAICASKTESVEDKSRWIEAALQALRASVDRGYDDFENLRDDEDLAILKALPEFDQLFPADFKR